jgi:hypothetical protein
VLPLRRLMLDGADAPALAEALAADLPLLPATESLPEVALAMAEGRPPRPRRSGLPSLPPEMTVEAALPFAVGHLLDVLLSEIGQCGPDAGPRGVHQSRVALRRLRSLVKLLRPKGSPEDSLWAEWAGELAELARVLGAGARLGRLPARHRHGRAPGAWAAIVACAAWLAPPKPSAAPPMPPWIRRWPRPPSAAASCAAPRWRPARRRAGRRCRPSPPGC